MVTEPITHASLLETVDAVLAEHGLTRDQFVELGSKDELENDELRDLWLMTEPALRTAS
jgi:hypothetical protein